MSVRKIPVFQGELTLGTVTQASVEWMDLEKELEHFLQTIEMEEADVLDRFMEDLSMRLPRYGEINLSAVGVVEFQGEQTVGTETQASVERMEPAAKLNQIKQNVEGEDELDRFLEAINTILEDTLNTSPPPPPAVPAEPGSNSHLQAVESPSDGDGVSTTLVAGPHSLKQPWMSAPSQAAPSSYQQPLTCHISGLDSTSQDQQPAVLLHNQMSERKIPEFEGEQTVGTETQASVEWMDLEKELENYLQTMEMEEADVVDLVLEAINTILRDTGNTSPPLPAVPAETGFNSHPQAVEILSDGYGVSTTLVAASHSFKQPWMSAPSQAAPSFYQQPLYDQNIMQSGGQLCNQAGAQSQEQYLPHQWPGYNVPGPAAISAPPQPYLPHQWPGYNVLGPAGFSTPQQDLSMWLPQGGEINLSAVGVVKGKMVYALPPGMSFTAFDPAAPPQNTSMSQKRKRESWQEEDQTYIKKPPNAFMLYMKEQRPKVRAELDTTVNSSTLNTILGQRWKSLSKEEQARYYEEANKERLLHAEQFPEWSSRNNYGKKRKRIRTKNCCQR
ncbi:uncharacterized protein LOC118300950 isoform X2 [Scophthalmus maximus]|uniref:uncharacterized protein LOC118300950 isoform X2 n=1 Tax=Scophthalmus maximus TaxID=52904 RepID=UPI0015E095DF|nr:uncharacterized protein LOC118300950 isoform X2 [Scophthalmus maximus]